MTLVGLSSPMCYDVRIVSSASPRVPAICEQAVFRGNLSRGSVSTYTGLWSVRRRKLDGAACSSNSLGPCKMTSGRTASLRMRPASSKMFVPGFGEKSPEGKAADSLHNFFTFLAVKIVLAQLQAYNPEGYRDLRAFADRVPLKDGDRFIAELMRESPQHKVLALRLLEVRSVYAHEDFEWENLKMVSEKVMDESNTRLMREFLQETSRMD
eukprot:TRINITY_DN26307_c0_g1_i1.p1 TRINITY_DN26307_c0_g1~~TRINITY_DN26307_c0_g1_i1.p1  ORF type:complete len:211 (-),score=21.27 TRINITY_DN26307_c0_g1_i1:909-1541(-)